MYDPAHAPLPREYDPQTFTTPIDEYEPDPESWRMPREYDPEADFSEMVDLDWVHQLECYDAWMAEIEVLKQAGVQFWVPSQACDYYTYYTGV